VPSWAGAISIDLLPAILVLILSIAHSAIRSENETLDPAEQMTAADMMRAVALHNQMTGEERAAVEEQVASSNTTVLRPIDSEQRKRIEESRG